MPENVETNAQTATQGSEITGGQGTSRRQFVGYAALFGAGAALVACSPTPTPKAMTAAEKQDIDILNYALTLEYLEADFYRRFDSGDLKGTLKDARVKEFARELAEQEAAHVAVLTKTIISLGGKPVPLPKFDYSSLIPDPSKLNDAFFLQLAVTFEPVGTRAYLGQAARLSNPDLLAAASSILAVEANHVSAIQELRTDMGLNTKPTRQTDIAPQTDINNTNASSFDPNFSPTPTFLWKGLTMAQTLAIVGPLIVK
ncbi:ferritin-like domain-containing protein [Deinococcus frigens]|uniref:ferritin-like domain-containing protein n=1 Tax=Deinococcus frigens TaxID=249403 RepID=UPI000A05C04D|nr:ferritin-like domain-containing protein [Deinococcus frigens]